MNLRLETIFQSAALLLITFGVLTSPPMVEAQEGLSVVRAERYEKYLLAQIARMQGNGETALKYFREVIEIDPQSDAAYESFAQTASDYDLLAEKIAEAEEGLKLRPQNATEKRILFSLLWMQVKSVREADQEKLIEIFDLLEGILPSFPENQQLLLNKSQLLGFLNRGQEALNTLDAILRAEPENVEALRLAGQIASRGLGDFPMAISYFEKIAALEDPPEDIWRDMALIYERSGKLQKAVESYSKALQFSAPDEPWILLQLGRLYGQVGRFGEAVDLFSQLAAMPFPSEQKAEILEYLAESLLRDGRPDESVAVYRRLLGQERRPEWVYRLALVEKESGLLKEAEENFQSVINWPDDQRFDNLVALRRDATWQFGLLAYFQEDWSRAREYFLKSIAGGFPDPAGRVAELAWDCLLRIDRFEDAEKELEDLGRRFPEARENRWETRRGELEIASGKTKQGVDRLQRTVGSFPDDPFVLSSLVRQLQDLERWEDAEAILLEKIEQPGDLDSHDLMFQLGALYERGEKLSKSIDVFERLISEHPDDHVALNYLGYMLADHGLRIADAYAYVFRAVQLEPRNEAYLDSLAWVLYRLGDLEAAEEFVRLAIRRTRQSAEIWDHLGDILAAQGRQMEARQSWEKGLEMPGDPGILDRIRAKLAADPK